MILVSTIRSVLHLWLRQDWSIVACRGGSVPLPSRKSARRRVRTLDAAWTFGTRARVAAIGTGKEGCEGWSLRQRHGRRRIANKKSFDLLNEIADRLLHARKADPSKEDTGRIAKAGKQVGS